MQLLEYNQILLEVSRAKFVIIDKNVADIFPDLITPHSSKIIYVLENAEASKNLEVFEQISNVFLEAGITRNDTVYSVGGGATSDIAGFVAATILRGVEWIAVPTTLLAMIDASIGGKVGINTKHGKNLIGNFHEPNQILVSPRFLETLSNIEVLSGKGELLKYLFLSIEIKQLFLDEGYNRELIFECGKYKQDIVEEDFKESGRRKILNLGHTFGHAFEKALDYPHGIAIVHGLELIINVFANECLEDFMFFKTKLDLNDIPHTKCSFDTFKDFLMNDKKRINQNEIEIIVPHMNDEAEVRAISITEIIKLLEQNESYSNYFE